RAGARTGVEALPHCPLDGAAFSIRAVLLRRSLPNSTVLLLDRASVSSSRQTPQRKVRFRKVAREDPEISRGTEFNERALGSLALHPSEGVQCSDETILEVSEAKRLNVAVDHGIDDGADGTRPVRRYCVLTVAILTGVRRVVVVEFVHAASKPVA